MTLSGGRGLRSAALRLRFSRITATGAFAVFCPLRLLARVRDHLERRTSYRRRAPRQHIALQPSIVPTRGFQRTLGDGEFDPLALQIRIELLDAPFVMARLNLPPGPMQAEMHTANGPIHVPVVQVPTIDVGGNRARDVTAVVHNAVGAPLAGILGLSYLDNFQYSIDPKKRVLHLH